MKFSHSRWVFGLVSLCLQVCVTHTAWCLCHTAWCPCRTVCSPCQLFGYSILQYRRNLGFSVVGTGHSVQSYIKFLSVGEFGCPVSPSDRTSHEGFSVLLGVQVSGNCQWVAGGVWVQVREHKIRKLGFSASEGVSVRLFGWQGVSLEIKKVPIITIKWECYDTSTLID